ncbi:MAG: bifunctional riboflavin kinase/FAD synthetase [Gammaproteobacteria bacterium]|nr:bifunctional riboflavin kinase/FAD synthetase [Gammaproteobacteria bacterium]
MKLARSIRESIRPADGCVLTIGNFDGVHRGHREIVRRLVESSREMDLPAILMTFFPSPQEFFRGDAAAARLSSVTSRYLCLTDSGIDTLLALPFNRKLAQTSAEDFILEYIVLGLGTRYLMVGDDFRFGAGRRGDYAMLEKYGGQYGFGVTRCAAVEVDGTRISSTRVRRALEAGDMREAERLLGRRFDIVGKVQHGDRRGRQWGFPTLNLPFRRKPPMTGVFAVRVDLGDTRQHRGVANLGTRPTVDGMRTLLEVHLFDFDEQVYGCRVRVEFVEKIRDECRFGSFDALKAQIARDCETAQGILSAG